MTTELKRTKSPRAYAARLASEQGWDSKSIELDRTRSNLFATKKTTKAYEIRQLVELARTRANFSIKFHSRLDHSKKDEKFLEQKSCANRYMFDCRKFLMEFLFVQAHEQRLVSWCHFGRYGFVTPLPSLVNFRHF